MAQKSDYSNVFALHTIAVVIPAYRSEKHILGVLDGIPPFVSFIIVVDDCSPDGLAELVKSYGDNDPHVYLVSHKENQRVGGAMLSGYKKSIELVADIVVKMDSDGQMEPAYIIPPRSMAFTLREKNSKNIVLIFGRRNLKWISA